MDELNHLPVCQPSAEWYELRDERGKLCARLEPRLWLLEVRRNDGAMVFDLHELLVSNRFDPLRRDAWAETLSP